MVARGQERSDAAPGNSPSRLRSEGAPEALEAQISPEKKGKKKAARRLGCWEKRKMVEASGIEPLTLRLPA